MSRITSEQRKELETAIDQITSLCEDGLHPNDAIVKTAKAMDLSKDRLPILVNIYNTGASTSHWKSSKDQNTKIASFPIADIDTIRRMLYPNQVKSASAVRQYYTPADTTFTKSASALFGNCFPKAPFEKCASAYKAPVVFREEDVDAALRKQDAVKQQARHIYDAYAMNKVAAEQEFDSAIADLADAMLDPNGPTFAQMRKSAATINPEFGAKVINHVVARFPKVKTAAKFTESTSAITSNSPFMQSLNKAIHTITKYAAAEANEKYATYRCQLMQVQAGLDVDPSSDQDMDSLLKTPDEIHHDKLRKSAAISLMDTIGRTGPHFDYATPEERAAMRHFGDQRHMRNQKVRNLLVDLINTDPYLREQDPDVVLSAFNDLYEANPVDATKRIWLKTQLPQYIASDRLDAASLASIIDSGYSGRKIDMAHTKMLSESLKRQDDIRKELDELRREDERRGAEEARTKERERKEEKREARERIEASVSNKRAPGNYNPAAGVGADANKKYIKDLRSWQRSRYGKTRRERLFGDVNVAINPYSDLVGRLPATHPIFNTQGLDENTNPRMVQELARQHGVFV